MDKIEKLLTQEKKQIDDIKTPDQLEDRLRSALRNTSLQKNKWRPTMWRIAAVAVILILIVGSNYNAFAYYGKKIFGIDPILSGTLKQLNDEGLGQTVDKTIILTDGTKFTINGVMTDENQLVLFYTMENSNGLAGKQMDIQFSNISGFMTNSFVGGGTATLNNGETEYTGMMTFDPVSPFAKKLTLYIDDHSTETGPYEITFDYDPNLAMQTELKQSIKKKIRVDQGTVTFGTITATPTVTVIEGSLSINNFDRIPNALNGVELWANGKQLDTLASGSTSTLKGFKFDIHYDALPKDLKSLQLVVQEFAGYEEINKRFFLNELDEPFILYDNKQLWINDVKNTSNGIEITIATDEDVMLDGVSMKADGEITLLKTTLREDYVEYDDGQKHSDKGDNEDQSSESVRFLKERVILFETTKEPEYILIEGIHYMKKYDEVIDIPVK